MAARSHFRAVRAVVLLLICITFAQAAYAQKAAAPNRGPDWVQLSPEQQRILAPLKDDWPGIEGARRQKWLDIAKRYPSMTPEQQQRLQSRMKHWASLSYEERAQARDRYKQIKQLPPEKRAEVQRKWQEYQSLPEEQKQTLRQAHPKSKPARPEPGAAGKSQQPGNADKVPPGSGLRTQPVVN